MTVKNGTSSTCEFLLFGQKQLISKNIQLDTLPYYTYMLPLYSIIYIYISFTYL